MGSSIMEEKKSESVFKHPIPKEDEERLEALFQTLDTNRDGKIDVQDLSEGLKRLGVPHSHINNQAQSFIDKADTNKDGQLDFAEFMQYVAEHEKNLRLQFSKLDRNKDGQLDAKEIVDSLKSLGVNMTESEAKKLLDCMDQDKTLKIDIDEWKNYLQFYPSSDLHEIVKYWKLRAYIDVGEDVTVPEYYTAEDKKGMWWRQLLAGGTAGAVSRTSTAPLDRIKVLLQVHASKKNQMGIISAFQVNMKEGGIKSFWRGNGMNVVKIVPESAIKFMAYEQIKRLIQGDDAEIKVYHRFISGSLAGAISQSTIYPMEVLKTRLTIRKTGQYKGVVDCAYQLYKTEGLKAFYRGYVPNLIGILPYAGIDLAVYETLKSRWLKTHASNPDPGVVVLLLCGTVSSTCGQLASYPLALVRTKLQAQAKQQDSMVALFKRIYQREGVTGLYRGILPNFMKVAPAVSISYVVYERTKKMLGL